MAEKGKWIQQADGSLKEGPTHGELIPENLRKLPGELVTKDIDDSTKAHALDEEHVVNAIKEEHDQKELVDRVPQLTKNKEKEKDIEIKRKLNEMLEFIPPGVVAPLSQRRIDGVRFRIINQLVNRAYEQYRKGEKNFPTLYHVWFPHNNIAVYELKPGKPPPDCLRPARLRGMDLVIDLENWPQRIIDALASVGIDVPTRVDIKHEMELGHETGEKTAGDVS